MKMMQQKTEFTPIALVLETERDVELFWDIISHYSICGASEEAYKMSNKISDWLSNQAKL